MNNNKKDNYMDIEKAYELAVKNGIDKKSNYELIDFIRLNTDFEVSREKIMYFLLDVPR